MKIFISYSSGNEEHTIWVGKLADDLEIYPDFHIILDQYDLDNLIDKNRFMESSVDESDFIIVIATKEYKRKADSRLGGVGIETQLNIQRHYEETAKYGTSNIIVVLREKEMTPIYLKSKIFIDFTDDYKYEQSLELFPTISQ